MLDLIPAAIVPLVSVSIGAALTYLFNVRTRRRDFVEDLFNDAIAAVAVADASQHYIWNVAKPVAMSEAEHRTLLAEIAKAAIENHTKSAGEARAALAKLAQFEPQLRDYYINATAVIEQPDEIITELVRARDGHVKKNRGHGSVEVISASGTDSAKASGSIEPFGFHLLAPARRNSSRTGSLSTAAGQDSDQII